MSKTTTYLTHTILIAIIALSVAGCDMFDSITGYFNRKKAPSQQTQTTAETSKTTSETKQSQKIKGNEVARVGSWALTVDEFNERLDALVEALPEGNLDITDMETRKFLLNELVNQQLIVLNAEKTGLAKQQDIVEAVEEFRKTLIVQEVASQIIENVEVSEQEARDIYEEYKDSLKAPVEYKVREIVVDDQIKANEISLQVLKEGGDFAEAAKASSIGKSAQSGGDLGFIKQVPFPEMAAPILSLDVGGISSPFKGPEGFYIIKLEDKRGGEQISFDEVKEEIIQNQTGLKQREAINEYLERIRGDLDAQVNESLL